MVQKQRVRPTPLHRRLVVWLVTLLGLGVGAVFYYRRLDQSVERPMGSSSSERAVQLPTVNDLRSGGRGIGESMGSPQGRSFSAVDLNTATLDELQTIPGIGRDFAEKIIAGRPYREMKELERTGIPPAVLAQISPPAILKVVGVGPIAPPATLPPPGTPNRARP